MLCQETYKKSGARPGAGYKWNYGLYKAFRDSWNNRTIKYTGYRLIRQVMCT